MAKKEYTKLLKLGIGLNGITFLEYIVTAYPIIIPRTPPHDVMKTDSTRNWYIIVEGLAPKALLIPISLLLSITDTYDTNSTNKHCNSSYN